MIHYDDETLSRYGLDTSLVPDPEGMGAHLTECDLCQGNFAAVTEIDEAMRDEETWATVNALLTRSTRLEQALALKARIDAEDAAAARMLARLLDSPLRFRSAKIAENPKAWHGGVVRYLCARANERHEKRPQFTLDMTTTAYAVALALEKGPESPRRFCMALSLRERANALRYLGRFADALKSLDYAEKLFSHMPATDPHDIAIIWFIRATVYMETDRLEEARALAEMSRRVFVDYGDGARELNALLIEASCLHFAGRNAEAAPAFEVVAAKARSEGDDKVLAHALNNAATAYVDLARYEPAERHYVEALVIFDALGLTTDKAVVSWSLALVLVRRGELRTGAARLDIARAELRRLGLLNDHALATLDWAEARLALNEPAGVAEACKAIIIRFESEGMMKKARLALAYAHEALARGTATPALIHHVRTYLELLPGHPDAPFVPLQ
jgi:tetratricopeptide (TPR) repeat protein